MFPAGYNNAYQIIQTPGYVTIHYEMIHDARIIPLDNRPRSARMQTWMGEPRGRWEGDTLVVETTNYHNKGWITTSAASGRIKGIPHSDKLRVIERFTARVEGRDQLLGDDRGSGDLHAALDDLVSAHCGSGLPHLRVRVPRRQLRDREHPERRQGAREGRDEITEVRPGTGNANDSSVVPEAMTTYCRPSSM